MSSFVGDKEVKTKFKVLEMYKGPSRQEIEVSRHSHAVTFDKGDEVLVCADGNSRKYYTYDFLMFSKRWIRGCYLDAYLILEKELQEKVEQNGGDAEVLRKQAEFYTKNSAFEKADIAFSRLIAFYPKDVELLNRRADIRFRDARFEEALSDFRMVREIDPKNNTARQGVVTMLRILNREEEMNPDEMDFYELKCRDRREHVRKSWPGRKMSGDNFSCHLFFDVDFSGADLQGAKFSGADVRGG
ncbi:MAG: pentapeptide repeat-containing protein [Candidatus Omnitrophota bacterium]